SWEMLSAELHRDAPMGKLRLYLAEAGSGQDCWDADLRQPLAIVVGGEAEGAGTEAHRLADASLCIPMHGGSESLNAGVAGSIMMFEVVRQRSSFSH
ncbi:MAG: hypothetical protein M1281_20405, partial [Chloroflexi bacterium]|nr:hypothetical protein [Chloroflexota bacterium]